MTYDLRSMTAAKTRDTSKLQDELRDAGLRATASRVAVLRLLHAAKAPLSHAEVSDALAKDGWDRATLYRNLLDFSKVGLAKRADLGDHVWRFELPSGKHDHDDHHPHFVCNSCGVVECIADLVLTLPTSAPAPKSIRAREVEVQITGRCDRCGPLAAARDGSDGA